MNTEFRRIAQPAEREPIVSWRALGTAALILFIVTVVVTAIAAAANVREDTRESRRLLETIQPCRPSPATR